MATTEQDILQRLTDSLKVAAECCDKLATEPRTGANYSRLRKHLKLIEGCARQMTFWRDDARWQLLRGKAATCHEKAGDWLRSYAPRMYFMKLSSALRQLHVDTERLRTQPTGRMGAILPVAPPPPSRSVHPVGWTPSKGGILMPGGMA
jgi:hypothetical protein